MAKAKREEAPDAIRPAERRAMVRELERHTATILRGPKGPKEPANVTKARRVVRRYDAGRLRRYQGEHQRRVDVTTELRMSLMFTDSRRQAAEIVRKAWELASVSDHPTRTVKGVPRG